MLSVRGVGNDIRAKCIDLMPQLVSPLAYQTSGKGAETEPEYLIKMFKRDLEAVNRRDGTQMELFEYRVHLMR